MDGEHFAATVKDLSNVTGYNYHPGIESTVHDFIVTFMRKYRWYNITSFIVNSWNIL